MAPDPTPKAPRRPALSPARICEAAMTLIDAEGLEAFSFRTLAARLGCQAMSIYHYYPSKTQLFGALAAMMIAEAADFAEDGAWADRLRGAAAAYRRAALNHPGFFPWFATFRLNTREGLACLERTLRIFEAAGLDEAARARHSRIFGFYLVGACLDAVAGHAKAGASRPVPFAEARLAYPALMAFGPYSGKDRSHATFDAGIEVLIRGIEGDAGR